MATPLSLPGQDDNSTNNAQGQGTTTNLNALGPTNAQNSNSGTPPPSTGGGTGVSAKGTSSSPNFSNNFKPTSSGSFTNLNNYLNANQGWNSSGGGLAGQVVSNINNQANTTQGDITNAQNAFTDQNTQAQNAYSGYTPDTATSTATSAVNNAVSNTGSDNPDYVSTISNLANAKYSGPSGLESISGDNNLTNLQTQASNLGNEASQTQTESGRYNLLNQMFGGANYNSGEQNLDNVLMESNPSQLQTLNGAQRIANNVTSNLNNTETQDQAAAQSAQTNDAALAAATKAALNSAASSYLNTLPGGSANPGTTPLSQYAMGANGIAANPYNTMTANQFTGLNNLNSLLGSTTAGTVGSLANTDVGAALAPYLLSANQAQAGQYQRDTSAGLGKNLGIMTPLTPVNSAASISKMAPTAPTPAFTPQFGDSGASGGYNSTSPTPAPMTTQQALAAMGITTPPTSHGAGYQTMFPTLNRYMGGEV